MRKHRQSRELKVEIRSRMGEIIRNKRLRCAYEKVDDEICIKRQRLNSDGNSNDSSDSDSRFAVPATSRRRTDACDPPVRLCEVSVNQCAAVIHEAAEAPPTKTSPKLRPRQQPEPKCCPPSDASEKPLSGSVADNSNIGIKDTATRQEQQCREAKEEEEDTRETRRRSPNGFLLPDPLPRGELLRDIQGQEWELGPAIGLGGFGELYLAARRQPDGSSSPQHFVIKVEPHSNGPLFVEIHFYLRTTRADQPATFSASHGIRHLGVPRYIASGSHTTNGQKYRFLVIERFGSDLQRILDHSEGGRFNDKTVCEVALQVLDALEFIHSQGYVHKDIKASNLLVGLGQHGQHMIHLVDYGLCSKYMVGTIHKQYTHDLRWAHEGTLEYTSRDAHIGSASRRGDLEVLLYNLVEWWGGRLPWDRDLAATPDLCKLAKFRAFANPQKFLRCCFARQSSSGGEYPPLLLKLMKYVGGLQFEEAPDYRLLRTLVLQDMSRLGCRQDGRMEFRLGPTGSTSALHLDESTAADFLRPPPVDGARLSAVFDRMCISERSWQAARDRLIGERDADSLRNPTQAMLDVMEKMKKKSLSETRKRNKSGAQYYGDHGPSHTPAMLEVMKLVQLCKSGEVAADTVDPTAAALLPARILPPGSPIPLEVVVSCPAFSRSSPPTAKQQLPMTMPPLPVDHKKLLARRHLGGNLKELDRLVLPEPETRRRTRSADVTDTELSRNLRYAFRLGLGNVTRMLRQVSDSFTKMF